MKEAARPSSRDREGAVCGQLLTINADNCICLNRKLPNSTFAPSRPRLPSRLPSENLTFAEVSFTFALGTEILAILGYACNPWRSIRSSSMWSFSLREMSADE